MSSAFLLEWWLGFASGTVVAFAIVLGIGLTGWPAFAAAIVGPLFGALALVTFARPE